MDERILKNPHMLNTLQRVRAVGLHKVAAQMHGMPELNIKTAMDTLGKTLYAHHLRHKAIDRGLKALEFLENQ